MRIKTYGTEYIVYLKRGNDTQTVEIVEASGNREVVDMISRTFKKRLLMPKNSKAPFVKVTVKRLDQIKKVCSYVMNFRIYNLSPRSARLELENAIRMEQ